MTSHYNWGSGKYGISFSEKREIQWTDNTIDAQYRDKFLKIILGYWAYESKMNKSMEFKKN